MRTSLIRLNPTKPLMRTCADTCISCTNAVAALAFRSVPEIGLYDAATELESERNGRVSGSSLVPAIRVSDMDAAIHFYRDELGFKVERGGPEDANVALSFGDARIMLDRVPTDYYSASYNEAIARRMGVSAPTAFYIESPDLDAHYERLVEAGIEIVDPIADRAWGQREFTVADPNGNWLSFWRALDADGGN